MRITILFLWGMLLLAPGLSAQSLVPNELLVQFKGSATAADKSRALARANARVLEDVLNASRRRDGGGDLVLVRHPPDLPTEAARRNLASDPAVEFAEPNWIYTHQADSNDPYFTNGSLWGMYGSTTTPANQYGSNAAAAWAAGRTGNATVYVGVIDEGIQYTHPDLAGQVHANPLEIANNGIDDDGNGFVDDVYGWDFAGNDNSVYDGGTKGNLDDHGTHVSGTIGARGGNGVGVAGVNWSISLISAKFLGRSGGTTANAIKALDYLTDLKRRGLNIVATNNSWGGGGFSQALYDAIKRSGDAGILFVAAAGNGDRKGVGINNDVTPHYPSSYNLPNIIAVGALTSTGAKATWSNYGLTSVDIFAPGAGIYSTTAYNKYESYSGTSMATPHVTGAAALYAAVKGLMPTDLNMALTIKNAILSSAVPTASVAGKCVTGGRLDVAGAIK